MDLRGGRQPTSEVLRAADATADVDRATVDQVLDDVARDGDDALRALTRRFDGVEVDDLVVPPAVARAALDALDDDLRAALTRAAEQVRWFHGRARPADWMTERDGARVGQRYHPLQRVGVYVPGGRAVYPSTVLMTVIPAQIAGVDEVVLCTPPSGGDGWPDATIIATTALLGVERVVRVGGAQAIAAMAYGTDSVPRCDKIVGPGNAFVALAKRSVQARGLCAVDTDAGPTEIAIVADAGAAPEVVAADLVAQAEHDERATCVLITDAPDLVPQVQAALEREVDGTRHRERVTAALTGRGTIVLVDDIDHALEVVDVLAPEHLEILTAAAPQVADRVRYAGAVFVGATSPVSLGDYAAGPNHTLPTGGTARHTAGLSTTDFLVAMNWVEYSASALTALAPTVARLAEAEDLPAHARAVAVRLEDGG